MALEWMSRDGKLLLTTRAIRSFGYGFLSIILVIYLHEIGFSDVLAGTVLSVILLGSAGFTIFASVYADRIGRRKMLLALSLLMATSGIVFAITSDKAALFIAAVIGTLSPTGAEIGCFLPMEQAILPQTTTEEMRTSTFATYNIVGTLSSAAGTLFSGLAEVLQSSFGLGKVDSNRALFLVYAALALVTAALYLAVSAKAEIRREQAEWSRRRLSPRSKSIIARLSTLFGMDAFAGGFVLQTIISYWFVTRYDVSEATLGAIFFVAGILSTVSFFAAAKLAKKIGLIRTMVFTHIPSNILLILVPIAPTFLLSLVFYLARQSISQMDVPTRQSYTMAVVSPEERVPAASITNISRNLAQATSPTLSGYAMQAVSLSSPFLIGGTLKIVYDIAVYFSFRNVRPPEEEKAH